MVALALLLQGLTVSATVDRDRAPVGDEIAYTLRATGGPTGTFRVELPSLGGLEIVDRSERLDPAPNGVDRVFQLDLTLRATEVGVWRIGPVLVLLGNDVEAAPEVTVTVTGAAAADPTRNPRLIELIRAVPSPSPGAAATLATVVSASRVYQGAQLDVLTAAWFSRSLRNRLRRPPTLKPPVLTGVWTVPQPPVPGVIATRAVGEDVYDLFISHQVAFPLTPGVLTVPAARVEYAIPISRRAGADERPAAATSRPVSVEVMPQPVAGRPAAFRGPTGGGLSVGYRVRTLPAYAAEPLAVDVLMTGSGNLAFWPPPNITWPAGTRAYLDRTSEAIRLAGGLLGGTKTFHFLLVPDSAGSVGLPPLDYEYFDPGAGSYRLANGVGLVIPVLPGKSRLADRKAPPLAPLGPDPAWLDRFEPRTGWWYGLAAVPLLLVAGRILLRYRRRWRAPRPAPRPALDGVAGLERLVSRLVPEPDRGHAELLERSLRRAGVPRDQAAAASRLQAELDRLRFGREGGAVDGALGGRAGALIRSLPRRILVRAGLLAAILVAAPALPGQEESPETLYREGAFGPAALGFEARARTAPTDWRPWYHAAAARFLAGDDARAAARLVRALEESPRAPLARSLWNTLERQYEPLNQAQPPAGPSRRELGIVSLGIWWVAALAAVGLWRHRRVRTGLLAGGALVLVVAAGWPPPGGDRAFLAAAVTLRGAPHGLAPDRGGLPPLTRVTIADRRGGWSLVVDRLGNRGWVPDASLAPIDRLD